MPIDDRIGREDGRFDFEKTLLMKKIPQPPQQFRPQPQILPRGRGIENRSWSLLMSSGPGSAKPHTVSLISHLFFHAFDIRTGSGVDLDQVADLDKGGAGELGAGVDLAGLGDIGGRVALGPGLAVFHPQNDVVGRRYADGLVVVQDDAANHAFLEIFPGVVDLLGGQIRIARRTRCP